MRDIACCHPDFDTIDAFLCNASRSFACSSRIHDAYWYGRCGGLTVVDAAGGYTRCVPHTREGRKHAIVRLLKPAYAAQRYQSRARCASACCHTFDTTLSLSRRSFGVLKILCTGRSLRCLGGGAQNYTRLRSTLAKPMRRAQLSLRTCSLQSRARFANACCHTFDTTLSLSRRSFGVLKILCTGRSLRCLGGGAQNCTRCVAHSRSPCVVRSSACVRARFNRALDARTLVVTPSTPPPPLSLSRRSLGIPLTLQFKEKTLTSLIQTGEGFSLNLISIRNPCQKRFLS